MGGAEGETGGGARDRRCSSRDISKPSSHAVAVSFWPGREVEPVREGDTLFLAVGSQRGRVVPTPPVQCPDAQRQRQPQGSGEAAGDRGRGGRLCQREIWDILYDTITRKTR